MKRNLDIEKALRSAGINLEGCKVLGTVLPPELAGKPLQARYAKPGDDGLTGLERRWEKELAGRKLAGEIADYQVHSIKLLISEAVPKSDQGDGVKGAWYTPDFVVYENDGTIAIYETKGYLDRAGDGWAKYKGAVARYPFAFYLVQREKGQWKVTRHK